MSKPYETLFYPLRSGGLCAPGKDSSVLFINAAPCDGLNMIKFAALTLQQYFKPYVCALEEKGYGVLPDLPNRKERFDYIFIAMPKNKTEAQYLLARGVEMLRDQGTLICAAGNDSGGKRLAGFFEALGIEDCRQESKCKSRVVWAEKPLEIDGKALQEWIKAGSVQEILDGKFHSVPGVFGWHKIDKGSEILVENLPTDLAGKGADFGCGYGYLSDYLLQHNPAIESLFCVDADFRAVEMCRKNIKKIECAARVQYVWEDLLQPVSRLQNLDWIVMNPPFHEGRARDISIGRAFIKTAAKSLGPGGALWMVANAGLPYEQILESGFKTCSKKSEGQGFKVYAAIK